MNRGSDLLYQPANLQAKLSNSFKPLIWKVIFTLLLIANLLVVGWVFVLIYYVFWGELSHISEGGMSLIAAIPPLLILSIIDFIAVLTFIITQHPQGIAKIISYTAFIAVSLVLAFVCWAVYTLIIAWYFDITLLVLNPVFIVAIF